MFTLKLTDTKILTTSIGIISDFITEATFDISKDGLKLIAMDPANISMVVLHILPSAFAEFSAAKPESITLNLDGLRQALRRIKPEETIALATEENKLKVTVTGRSTKRFILPLLEKENKERKVPALEFTTNIEMDAAEFRDYIDDAGIVGDAITFDANFDKLGLAAGDTGRKVQIELKKGSDVLLNFKVKEPVNAIYSVEYLKKMAKSASLADTVVLQFSKDYPLQLDFKALNKGQMTFILAPRIENK